MTEQRDSINPVGLAAGLAAYLWWGLSPLYWAWLDRVPAVDITAHRAFWAVPFCALVLLFSGRMGRALRVLARPRNVALLLLSSSLIAINWGLFIWSIGAGRLAEASLGYFLQPLVNVVLGLLFFRERLTAAQWLAVAFATAGVTVFVGQVGHLPLVALGVAFSFGFYGALRKALPIEPVDGLFVETLLLVPLSLGWIGWRGGGGLGQFDLTVDLLLLLAGAFTALPLIAFVASAQRLPLITLGFLIYINPSCQLLLALFWFGEALSPAQAWCFGLVWIGLAIYLGPMLRAERGRRRMARLGAADR